MNIYIKPKNNAGNIDHYYHFLFGYLLPFIQNTEPNDGNEYYFDDCGPLNKHILSLPCYSNKILSKESKIDSQISYSGFDNNYYGIDISKIQNRIHTIFSIDPNLYGNKTILIDRAHPEEYYLTKARLGFRGKGRTSGSSRRAIPNINDIYHYLLEKKIDIKKIYLENMTFLDQIILFKTSSTIIAQHGASMSNLIWCNKGTNIIEIRTRKCDTCYMPLPSLCNLKYIHILQAHNFSDVNPISVYKAII